ncbi:MAG TPA: polysaccharide pyruvyl transferase family protein, partial [Myxococcota bacterium]|nr:polysaccharide pyruvyl transferase family protein [Myxococcota bacterium]
MKPAYVLLSGARRNAGDFLITERAVALLQRLRPDRELRVAPAWEPLDPHGELLRDARAVLIAGGPGFQPAMVPEVYPLAERLDELPCPVIPFGVGWKGRAGDAYAVRRYAFTARSRAALRWMADRTPLLGCRDGLTQEVLRRHGIGNTALVGCPVWYDAASLGKDPEPPRTVERVVFTPAQLHALRDQSVEVARRIAELLPRAEKICSFHRGLDEVWMPRADAENNRSLAAEIDALGFDVVDVSGDASRLRFYDECTLHVGYRVHAHLYFLSKRKPSLLVEEDGRGAGASQALGIRGVPAFRRDRLVRQLLRRLPGRRVERAPDASG